MKDHLNRAIIRTSRQARSRAITLGRHLASSTTTTSKPTKTSTTTAKQPLQKLPRHLEGTPLLTLRIIPPTPTSTTQSTEVILDPNRGIRRIDLGRAAGAHERSDHGGRVDGAVALGTAERADLAGPDLPVADDGRVGLRAAAVAGAVARGAVGDCGREGVSA